jgi:hypothetical protein
MDQPDDPKLSTMKEFARIASIKINYSKLFDGVRSTDDKCALIRRILAKKGLLGEPTIAKCKQLRLDLQAKRESAELDTSVIIRAEGKQTSREARQVRQRFYFLLLGTQVEREGRCRRGIHRSHRQAAQSFNQKRFKRCRRSGGSLIPTRISRRVEDIVQRRKRSK